MAYNATVTTFKDGKLRSVFVAEVDAGGNMLRSNAVQCTGLEGTAAYDSYVRRNAFHGCELAIALDGCQGYRSVLRGLSLPPAYRV